MFRSIPACIFASALLALQAQAGVEKPPPLTIEKNTLDLEPKAEESFQKLLLDLRHRDPASRLRAAHKTVALAEADVALAAKLLARPLPYATDLTTYRGLIHGIWGQYPNPDFPKGPGKDPPMWLVRPEPKWTPPPRVPGQPRPKKPEPHDPEKVDWLKALAHLDLGADELTAQLTAPLAASLADGEAARGEALLKVALLRGLSLAGAAGKREAVQPVFDFAFAYEGIFRDECGRLLRAMGSYAIPTLVGIYQNRQKGLPKMRRYAAYQLDRMDRLRPTKAISTAPDDLIRSEILHAYGEHRALDAVEAVLGQVNATSHRVRREARWAWRRYVDGPPPPPSPKRKRKLPGGAEEAEEKEDYLNYREMATLEIRKEIQKVLGKAPEGSLSPSQMTDQLFAHYDTLREREFHQLFEKAKDQERIGELAAAVDAYGWILAHQPDHPRRKEMAPAYLRLGEKLCEQGEQRADPKAMGRGLGLLRQSLALNPEHPQAGRIKGRIHYLDGRQAELAGGSGASDFAYAVKADPTLQVAERALWQAERRSGRSGFGYAGIWALGVLCMGLGLITLRRQFSKSKMPQTPFTGADI